MNEQATRRELRHLEDGESPWDDWSREQLVRFAQRCYYAMHAASGVMGLLRYQDNGLFWQRDGTGGRAQSLCSAVAREVGYDARGGGEESENLWRAFYRNYHPLLFADAVDEYGESLYEPRYTCDTCRSWYSAEGGIEAARHFHESQGCAGTVRLMTPADLPPVKEHP